MGTGVVAAAVLVVGSSPCLETIVYLIPQSSSVLSRSAVTVAVLPVDKVMVYVMVSSLRPLVSSVVVLSDLLLFLLVLKSLVPSLLFPLKSRMGSTLR